MNAVDVSIIITSYNQGSYLKAALKSVYDNVDKLKLQVIVVDDCSSDNTLEILEKLQAKHKFTVHINKTNLGPGNSRNVGLDQAIGDYVCFLDSDDYFLPHRLIKQLNFANSFDSMTVTYCDTLNEVNGHLDSRKPLSIEWPPASGDVYERLLQGSIFSIHAALVPKKIYQKYRFDTTTRSGEDLDYWLQIAEAGNPFQFLNEPLVVYRRHAQSLSMRGEQSYFEIIKVLERQLHKAPNHSPQAAYNLRYTLSMNYRLIARFRLDRKNKSAVAIIKKSEELISRRKLEWILYKIIRVNFTLGRLLYNRFRPQLGW